MGFNSWIATTTTAIALVLLGHPLAGIAGTLTPSDQSVPEKTFDFQGKLSLFKVESDEILLLEDLNSLSSPSLMMAAFFKGMTLAGNWQPETQLSFLEKTPQWDFQPTGWTSFR